MSAAGPRLGWTSDPNGGTTGMAHATCPGQSISLCGASTPFLGDLWPQAGQDWPSSFCRCASCARRLDAARQQ